MAKGKLEVIQAVPTAQNAGALVRRFGRKEYGVVSTLSDSFLGTLKGFLDEQTLVDLKPFGEFVRQVHSQATGQLQRLATSRQVLTAIALACEEIPDLGPYEKVREMAGFHEVVRDVQRLFLHWQIDLSATKCAGVTGEKAKALAKIFDQVTKTLEQAGTTTASNLMNECLPETLDLDGQEARLLLFVRGEVHPLAIRWIHWLVEQGAEVQVVLDRHATEADIFRGSATSQKLLGQAGKDPGDANRLLNNLFATQKFEGSQIETVEVHALGEPFAEAEWALRKAVELQGKGSVAIYARDRETYLPVLIAASQRMNVPIRLNRRTPLRANGFVKSAFACLNLLENADVRPLGSLMRTGYLGKVWDQDVAQKIDQIHQEGGEEWRNLEEALDEKSAQVVVTHLNQMRVQIQAGTKTYLEWYAFFRDSIEKSPWFESVTQGSSDGRDQRAFTALLSNLGQDATIRFGRSPDPVPFADWKQVFAKVLEGGDASVPVNQNGIHIASSVDDIGLTDYAIALGLLEGAFPRRRSENPILSDEDLAEIGGEANLPNSFDIAASERDHFYRLCACATQGLILSYPLGDGERDNISAFYLEEVKRICDITAETQHPRKQLLPEPEHCIVPADKELSSRLVAAPGSLVPIVLNEPVSQDLIRFNREQIRPSELRAMRDCTFRFAAQRKLPLPSRLTDFWGYLLRVPERANLLTSPSPEAASVAMSAAYTEVLDGIRPLLANWELDLMSHGSERVFKQWIEREFMSRELWKRDTLNTRLGGELSSFSPNSVFREKLAGVTEQEGVRTLHIYRRVAPDKMRKDNVENYLLEFGAMIETAWVDVHDVRIEIESLGDNRTLILYTPDDAYRPPQSEGFVVINLGEGEATRDDLRRRLKEIYSDGLQMAKSGQMPAHPGDHCARCNVSDLCRRAMGASEEEDIFTGVSDE